MKLERRGSFLRRQESVSTVNESTRRMDQIRYKIPTSPRLLEIKSLMLPIIPNTCFACLHPTSAPFSFLHLSAYATLVPISNHTTG